MDYEAFRQYMINNLGKISKKELIKLWTIYEQFYFQFGKKAVEILDLLVFIKKNIKKINIERANILVLALIEIKFELQLHYYNNFDIENIIKINPYYDLFDEKMYELCIKFINEKLNKNISHETKTKLLSNFYKNQLKDKVSNEQLNNILKLHCELEIFANNNNMNFAVLRSVIIECYNKNNNFNYIQSMNWCYGVISTFHVQDFHQLSVFFKRCMEDENYEKFLKKYYILGCLYNLDYVYDNDLDNSEVRKGEKYLIKGNDINSSIVESLNDYCRDLLYPNKSSDFIYGMIKEWWKVKEKSNKIKKIFMQTLNIKTNLDDQAKKYLWEIYNDIQTGKNINYNVIDILVFLYDNIKESDKTIYYKLEVYLDEVKKFFNKCYRSSFSDYYYDETKNEVYNKIKTFDLDDDLKVFCYKYAEETLEKNNELYYEETNIEDFFYNQLFIMYRDKNLKKSFDDCCYIYNKLINFKMFEDIPKYIIKNTIIESYRIFDERKNKINKNNRLNFCIGVLNLNDDYAVSSINKNIYDYYNNETIDSKYKNKYFCYGNIYDFTVDSFEPVIVEQEPQEFINGTNYYEKNEPSDNLFNIARNIDDYWHDDIVKEHDINFQLGIFYQGLENMEMEKNPEKILLNKNKKIS